jgi:hypothetical protein
MRAQMGSGNGRFWGGEAFLRSFLLWQCQHGIILYTVPYFTVINVCNYGKIRCDNYSSIPYYNKYGPYRTNRNRTIPYNSTSLNKLRD